MRSEGALSSRDLGVLESNNKAFEGARSVGILEEKGKGNFVWKEGIGPFSPEWTSIVRPILRAGSETKR
jgi:hypothetical protein